LVDAELLKGTGASGVIHKGNGVQVVYGPKVSVIKSNLEEFIESGSAAKLPSKEDYYGLKAVEKTEEKVALKQQQHLLLKKKRQLPLLYVRRSRVPLFPCRKWMMLPSLAKHWVKGSQSNLQSERLFRRSMVKS
jgi:hypothetical protein